ncbi:hypothetical protein KAW65_08320 [candidate division WOR-3 bacterium]|nr:hypothetical protein [candidate division WOR-3 bacterium]
MLLLSLGLGLFAPTGGLANIYPVGKSVKIVCESCYVPLWIGAETLAFDKNELHLNVSKITIGTKVKMHKMHIGFGVGGYYLKEKLNTGSEDEFGVGSCFAFYFPFLVSEKVNLTPEISYSTVPKGISLNLNIEVKL